jgi:hypothetical protein
MALMFLISLLRIYAIHLVPFSNGYLFSHPQTTPIVSSVSGHNGEGQQTFNRRLRQVVERTKTKNQ